MNDSGYNMDRRFRILLAEDERTLSTIISETLEDEGYEVFAAADGATGLKIFSLRAPDLVIADVMMPVMDGFEMAKRIRRENPGVPLLFLTARSSIDDIETGFDLGADDYLRKPFSMRELTARIRALLRRRYHLSDNSSLHEKEINLGRYVFSPVCNRLECGGHVVELSNIESMLLAYLAAREGETVRSSELMEFVWKHDDYYNRNSLHGYIHKLRNHLRHDPDVSILNLRGIGYRLAIHYSDR